MSLGHGASIVRDGLVLHLDAANPKSYPGSGTTCSNLNGESINGTLLNGVAYISNELGSLVFDGSNDYINLGTPSTLRIEQEVTVSAWVNIQASDTETSYRCVVGNATTTRNYNFYVKGNGSGAWLLHLSHAYNGNTSPLIGTLSDYVLQRNKWYNIVGTISAVTDKHEYFINGSLSKTVNVSAFTSMTAQPAEYWIGRADNYFRGNISDVKIYNRTLSASEIKQNFEALRGRYGI